MVAPRIAPLPQPPDKPPVQNIFRTLGHNPALTKGFLALGAHLLLESPLPPREREIVILRVGYRCASEYEFGQHTTIALDNGLTAEEVALLADPFEEWTGADGDLVQMVDELCKDDAVHEETWQRLRTRWSESDVLELLVLVGYYRLVSGLLNSVGVALEPETPGWPEGARNLRRAPRDPAQG